MLRELHRVVERCHIKLVKIFFLELFSDALMLLLPFGVRLLIDRKIDPEWMMGLVLGLVLCVVLRCVFIIWKDREIANFIEEVAFSLRRKMFAAFLMRPSECLKRFSWGDIVCLFSEDIQKVRNGLYYRWFPMMHSCLSVVLVAIGLWVLSPFIFLYGLVFIALITVMYAVFYPKLYDIFSQIRRQISKSADVLMGLLNGWDMIVVYGLRQKVLEHYSNLARCILDGYVHSAIYTSLLMGLSEFVLSFSLVLILCLGIFLSAKHGISLGTVIAGYVLLGMLVKPMIGVSAFFSSKGEFKFSLQQIVDLLKIGGQEVKSLNVSQKVIKEIKELMLENVSFSYGMQQEMILKEISLEVKKGDFVLILGENGSGKTTLLRLMAILYLPTSGRMMVNGTDIRDVKEDSFFRRIGVVFSDSFFLRATLRENLLVESKEQEDLAKRLIRYFGINFPLDIVVEEMGKNLSSGQRKRLSLVRALLRRPDVLILDEIFANVDETGCNKILDYLCEFCGRGGIVILASNKWIDRLRKVATVIVELAYRG